MDRLLTRYNPPFISRYSHSSPASIRVSIAGTPIDRSGSTTRSVFASQAIDAPVGSGSATAGCTVTTGVGLSVKLIVGDGSAVHVASNPSAFGAFVGKRCNPMDFGAQPAS